jgi:hypothetical protein
MPGVLGEQKDVRLNKIKIIELISKLEKAGILEDTPVYVGDGSLLEGKVSKDGDTMTGSLTLPSIVLNGGAINNLTDSNIDNSTDTIPTSNAVLTLHRSHSDSQNNPHNVTKTQVVLGNVDNTSDVNKPISIATQTAITNSLNRVNHTGTQSGNTISDFQTFVEFYEKPGYTKGGIAVIGLENQTEYIVDGSVPLLELPPASGTGGRVLLVCRSGGIGVNLSVSNFANTLNGVVHGTYTFINEFEIVLCINSHSNGWTVKRLDNVSLNNYETTAQLNTRDINNKNRSNHTGVQLYSTINNFETGVQIFEKAGYKKNAIATTTLVFDNLYIVEGTNTSLTLPQASGTGKRIMLISTPAGVTASVRLYTLTNNYLNDEFEGTYNFLETNDVVELIDVASNKWVLKSLGEKPTPVFTGWGRYEDTLYTSSSPLIITATIRSKLLNNAGIVINSQLPTGVTAFWNGTTNKLIAVNSLDVFTTSIRFKGKSTTANDSFKIAVDIGGAVGEVLLDCELFTKAANTEQSFTIPLHYITSSAFIINGGEIFITSTTGQLSIYEINFLITRVHKGI